MSISTLGHIVNATYLSYPSASACDGNYVYVGNFDTTGYFAIIDISNPASPTIEGFLNGGSYNVGSSYQLCYDNNYVYYASRENNCCTIINVADSTAPVEITTLDSTSCIGVAKEGNYLYVSSYSDNNIKIYDVTDPTNPIYKSTSPTIAKPGNLFIDGNYLYYVRDNQLGVLNVTSKTVSYIQDSLTDADWTNSLECYIVKYGNYVHIVGSQYFTIVDVSDPSNISKRGSISGSNLSGICESGGLIYYSDSTGIYKIDVSDPDNPFVDESLSGDVNWVSGLSTICSQSIEVHEHIYVGSNTLDSIGVIKDEFPGYEWALDCTSCNVISNVSNTGIPVQKPLNSTISYESNVGVTLSTSPSAPSNLEGTITGVSQITLNWDSSIDSTSYNIYWSLTPGVTIATGTKVSGISGTTYIHTGLNQTLTYYYIVTSENWVGESPESSEISVNLERYCYFTYEPLPADLSLILDGLYNDLLEPISYAAITGRPSSRSDRSDKLDELATYFSESISDQFLYGVSSVSSMLGQMNPNLKAAIDALFVTEEGDVAISNLLRTLDGWISDTDNVGSDAPNIEIMLRGLGSSEQASILNLVEFFKPYRSRLVFIGSTFSIDNKLTESTIIEDDSEYIPELSFGYDSTAFPEFRSNETVTVTDLMEYEEIVDIDEMINWHTVDSTSGHYLSYELFNDSTSEIETVLIADGFWDFDDEGAYFDVPFGSDIVTIEVT